MLISASLLAAVAVGSVGLLILWSNPARWVNRLVFSCSLHISAWLAFVHLASSTTEGLIWLRWATSVSALIPVHFWLVKEAIVSDFDFDPTRRRRMAAWLAAAGILAIVPFTEYFIPSHSTSERRLYGIGYYLYIAGVFGLYVALALSSFRRIHSLSGGRRLALQVWLWGGCAAAATILLVMMVNAVSKSYIRLQPFVVLVYYAATAYAITTHRIFDARQLFLIGSAKVALIVAVSGVAFFCYGLLEAYMPEAVALFATTAVCLAFASYLDGWLDRVLHFIPEATAARKAAFSAAQRESRVESLELAFCSVLKGWGQSERAIILSGAKGALAGNGIELLADSPVLEAIHQLRWATPERLARERPSHERRQLLEFLNKHELGVFCIEKGPALTIALGVGVTASRRPFTYPQVTQLMELASIIESALERAHFSTKVQHTEQLATVGLLGASLAHEIRNPLVSIKTFVQLLPTHHHDAAFRDKFFKLIGDEVGRIDQLTEQLLDLASPRTYAAEFVDLHALLRSSLELVAAKAAHKNVALVTEFSAAPDRAFTDASAAKQVLLNLCFNAIQAVEAHAASERWVKVATRNTSHGVEMAIADSGPGIAPEMRPRLFQPFQTTKSSGFGLGLAICSDILANLNASISVDPPEPGRGATFRVTFPCQPLSS